MPNNTKKSDIFNIADFAEIDKKAAKVHMSFYSMNFAFIWSQNLPSTCPLLLLFLSALLREFQLLTLELIECHEFI